MQLPNRQDMERARRILRYLKSTSHYELYLGSPKELVPECYVDADYANSEGRKSITGYATRLGESTVSWISKSQDTVALSTTEAEYMAASKASQQMIWERSILNELGVELKGPSILHEDNMSAISLIKHPKAHTRTKHIDVRHHYIRETIDNGMIQVIHCPTESMHADMMTKALSEEAFTRHRNALGLLPRPPSDQEQSGNRAGESVEGSETGRGTKASGLKVGSG
jgi:hypothetical protein